MVIDVIPGPIKLVTTHADFLQSKYEPKYETNTCAYQ